MNKILGEHEAEVQQEIREEKKRALLGRVRTVSIFLFAAMVLVFSFCYREKIVTVFNSTVLHKSDVAKADATDGSETTDGTPTGKASASLSGAKQNAETRDKLVEDLAK